MKCTKVCNFGAISVENNVAKIDYEKCKSCGMCAAVCPSGAINSFKPLSEKLKEAAEAAFQKSMAK